MLLLDHNRQGRGRPRIPGIAPWMEYQFYNKATAFYWTPSAYVDNWSRSAMLVILGSIWNTWFDALGREPEVQLDEFFATPVSIGEEDAKSISKILLAHKYVCAQVQRTLDEKRAGAKILDWLDILYFKLHPLCEALITVFDEYNPVVRIKHTDGFYHYDDVGNKQTILLVRTGREDKLSAEISFESLKHEALPLERSEDMRTIDIIRVPLPVGVRFVATLLLREEAAFPELVLGGPHMSKEPDNPFMKREREAFNWGEEQFAPAQEQEQGKISPSSTTATVKKAVLHYPGGRYERVEQNDFELGWV